jgi:hypothetical protein
MRKWKTTAIAIAALLVTLVVLTRSRAKTEPQFQGRPLHHWVQALNTTNSQSESDAEKAIDHIGTNALPFLLKWIAYDPHPSKLGRFTANFLAGIPATRKLGPIRRWVYADERQLALAESTKCAFRVLGPRAAPAVSGIAQLLGPSQDPGFAPRAVDALCCIGPPAMPALIKALTNGNPDARFWSATAMLVMGTNATPAVPALIICLKDPACSAAAFLALGALKLEPQLAVPAIADMAHDPDPIIRLRAIVALADYGHLARSALPTIRAALVDPDPTVRDSATNSLRAVASETLTNDVAQ